MFLNEWTLCRAYSNGIHQTREALDGVPFGFHTRLVCVNSKSRPTFPACSDQRCLPLGYISSRYFLSRRVPWVTAFLDVFVVCRSVRCPLHTPEAPLCVSSGCGNPPNEVLSLITSADSESKQTAKLFAGHSGLERSSTPDSSANTFRSSSLCKTHVTDWPGCSSWKVRPLSA